MNAAGTRRLRIFSGRHAGAELTLATGVYLIGRDERCDVVLSDASVASQHARLTIERGSATLAPLAQPTLLDGVASSADAALPIVSRQSIMLGAVCLGLDGDGDADGDADDDACASLPATPPAARRHRLGALTRLAGRPRRVYPLLALAMLAGSALLVVSSANTTPHDPVLTANTPQARVERVIETLRLDRVALTTDRDGVIELRGFVATARQKRELAGRLRPLGATVRSHVRADDDVAAAVSATLREFGLTTLRVADSKTGTVAVRGYAADAAVWQRARRAITRDVGGVVAVDAAAVETFPRRLAALRRRLRDAGLEQDVRADGDGRRIVVEGALDPEAMAAWRRVERDYLRDSGGQPPLRVAINRAPDLALAIQSVSVGRTPYLTLRGGGRYLEGSTLENGYLVKSILPDRLILHRDGRRAVYYLGAQQ